MGSYDDYETRSRYTGKIESQVFERQSRSTRRFIQHEYQAVQAGSEIITLSGAAGIMDGTWKCAHEGYSSSMETADISYDNAIKEINDYGTQAGSQPWTIGTSTTSLWQQCERQVQILWHGGGNGGTYCITMSNYRGSQGDAARSLYEGEAGIQTRQHIQRESRAISTREISTQDHHEARLI